MALPIRTSMRLLSQRLQYLQRGRIATVPLAITHSRYGSRYSKPTRRTPTTPLANEDSALAFTAPSDTSFSNVAPADDPLALHDPVGAKLRASVNQRKRSRWAGIGLIFSLIGMYVSVKMLLAEKSRLGPSMDASDEANAKFQGKEVHVIGVGDGKRIVAEDAAGAIDLVETGTSSVPHFPKTIYLPTAADSEAADPNAINLSTSAAGNGNGDNLEQYTLLGLGIRSVSFLGIQVYVMGMYVRTRDLTSLQANLIHLVNPSASTLIPSEKVDLEARLLDAQASSAIWDDLLQTPGFKTAWRIVPTRNTDFMHLRDGWITGINKRTAEAKKNSGNVPSEYDREDFGVSVRSFMSLFQGGKAPKGSVMTLARTSDGTLEVFFAAKTGGNGNDKDTQSLGSIADERISKLIWLNYLAGSKVSSEPARKGVAEGCVALASRPVGSAEHMVA